MILLTRAESEAWTGLGRRAVAGDIAPDDPMDGSVPRNLLGAFRYYVGTMLSSEGEGSRGLPWFRAGAMVEASGLFLNTFLVSFLERQAGRLRMPEVIFADPAPFVHFSTVPAMEGARKRFVRCSIDALPLFDHPVRIMDIGCGDGALTARLLRRMLSVGRAEAIDEVLLVDPSAGMVDLAERTLGAELPGVRVRALNAGIEEVAGRLEGRFDLAMSSLAYHHLPRAAKREHLERIASLVDNFLLFELDANNDGPELATPELALSVYQSYGRIIDFVFSHDAPMDLAVRCVDNFLMSEVVSFMTRPRGERTDYHMMRRQWHELLRESLGEPFEPRCDVTCYSDEHIDLYSILYGRT